MLALQPQLYAKITQSFVDFGNLVSSALPELFEQAAQSQGQGSDPAAGEAVEAIVDAVAENADAHAGAVGSLAGVLADHIDTLAEPAPQLEQVLTAVRGIESYWREVAEQLQAVPEVLSDGDPDQVAELRALAPIWDRVADRIDQAQRSMEMPTATGDARPLKVIEGGKDIEEGA
ncbi:MAG TPA: hypothetical protein VEA60_06620 [Allosphingosinicella sp.]|nr:hypothetical protein [Allosphingosinicella sp.]